LSRPATMASVQDTLEQGFRDHEVSIGITIDWDYQWGATEALIWYALQMYLGHVRYDWQV